jgi:hypothetical protein
LKLYVRLPGDGTFFTVRAAFLGAKMISKVRLGIKAKGREIHGQDGSYRLRESPAPYKGNFEPENEALRLENEYFWEDIP